ncbi:hypothetical protein CFOL_v3_35713, partial [Cephalotus follicularis]
SASTQTDPPNRTHTDNTPFANRSPNPNRKSITTHTPFVCNPNTAPPRLLAAYSPRLRGLSTAPLLSLSLPTQIRFASCTLDRRPPSPKSQSHTTLSVNGSSLHPHPVSLATASRLLASSKQPTTHKTICPATSRSAPPSQ